MSIFKEYKTKPNRIKAVKVTVNNIAKIADTTCGTYNDNELTFSNKKHNSRLKVKIGEWLLKFGNSEYYPCSDKFFNAKYEEIEEIPEPKKIF